MQQDQLAISLEQLDALVRSLSIEERAQLTSGVDAWHAGGVDSIGLEPMTTLDGPNGVRGVGLPKGSTATCTPCGSALGATWDVELVAEVAARIGLECKRAGVSYLLGPFMNLVRSPLGGRNFESFSEDPILAAQLGAAYIAGIQSEGVAACPKHLACNDSEAFRTSVNCVVDERTLREVYLVPFETAARTGAWSMMAAYNRVNGTHCSDNAALMNTIVREEWGWDGVMMSDWHATHDTKRGSEAGLDLEMPGPPRHFGPALAAAVRRGEVDEEVLNAAALRVVMLAVRVGALPITAIDAAARSEAAAPASPARARSMSAIGVAFNEPVHLSDADASALVRRAAAQSFVLLANDGVLPLNPSGIRKIAVIGPNSAKPCIQGGGAAHISEAYAVSPLDGLRKALPDSVEVVHRVGCGIELFLPDLSRMGVKDLDGNPGITVEWFVGQEPSGAPITRTRAAKSDLHLFGDLPAGLAQDDFAVRVSGWITPTVTGPHRIAMRGLGGRRLYVNGEIAADDWNIGEHVDVPTALFEGREDGRTFALEAGKPALIVAEIHSNAHVPSLLAIGCAAPEPDDPVALAAAAAAEVDVAIVVVGTDETWESEGRDRKTTALPGRQDELVRAVAAANKRTVVVVNSGAQMNLPWADSVSAVVYGWFSGQEFGNALADVLLGKEEPGGRLPFTLAKRDEDYPAFGTQPDSNGDLVYVEGVGIGYRGFDMANVEPRFAFGHGLGYTTFEYEELDLSAEGLADGEPLEIRVKVRNTGKRAGKEVIQVYVAPQATAVRRPPLELKGFAAVSLEPDETAEVTLALEDRDLAYWDAVRHRWHVEPGRYEIGVGHSSRDIRLRASFELA